MSAKAAAKALAPALEHVELQEQLVGQRESGTANRLDASAL
jgi:hypothetical protein